MGCRARRGRRKMEGVSEDIVADLRANFEGECSEVGMYLAMARVAHREGYPEIGLYWEKAAHEEAEHAAKFAELLGEVVTDSTKKNLEMRVEAENGATAGKTDLAKRAKAAGLDAIHDTVHEMARDELATASFRRSAQALLWLSQPPERQVSSSIRPGPYRFGPFCVSRTSVNALK